MPVTPPCVYFFSFFPSSARSPCPGLSSSLPLCQERCREAEFGGVWAPFRNPTWARALKVSPSGAAAEGGELGKPRSLGDGLPHHPCPPTFPQPEHLGEQQQEMDAETETQDRGWNLSPGCPGSWTFFCREGPAAFPQTVPRRWLFKSKRGPAPPPPRPTPQCLPEPPTRPGHSGHCRSRSRNRSRNRSRSRSRSRINPQDDPSLHLHV